MVHAAIQIAVDSDLRIYAIDLAHDATVGERSRNSKFSYVSPRSIYGETSNEGRRVHLHTLVDRERKRSRERG